MACRVSLGLPAWLLPPLLVSGFVVLAGAAPAWSAEPPSDNRIFTCVDADGRRLSSDRPIPECLSREQRLLRRDGSTKGVLPPLSSPDEQERLEALAKEQSQAQAVQSEAVRRDRMLLVRYPDPKAFETARLRALAPVQQRIEAAEKRLKTLAEEAAALEKERTALAGKPVSADWRSRNSVNEGSAEAQRNILKNQSAEVERLKNQFSTERVRLEQLWGGLAPGSNIPAAPAASRAGSEATPR